MLIDAPAPTLTPAAPPTGRLRRAWALPLWLHAAALAVVLVALVPVLGTNASFSADEGAAINQARHLSSGGGWVVEHPLPQADPAQVNYPIELSTRGAKGTAPFVKHPLYALLLAAADRIGGVAAMVLLSVAGTVMAAALAAAVAARMGPRLTRPTLWVVGLASPLVFDGYLVIAHTLGAAAAAGAVLCALRATEGRRPVWAVVGAGACIAFATLLRNEAVLFALGLAVTTGALAVARRHLVAAGVACASLVAAAAAHLLEEEWIHRILGGQVTAMPGGAGVTTGFVAGRIRSFATTWLRPSYGGPRTLDLALLMMVALLVLGAVVVRRHPGDRRAVVLLGTVAAGAAVVALLSAPTNIVPGLLVAFPLLAAGLAVLRRQTFISSAARLAFATFGLFALAVAATQYARGGSGEWGGRYFALGLPVVAPVVVFALGQAGSALGREARRAAAVSLVVCSFAMVAMGLSSLRHTHRFTAQLVARAADAGAGTGDERPVMVATNGAVPRLAWSTFDRQRWLLSDPKHLADLVTRLGRAGVTRFILVTDNRDRDGALVGSEAHIVSEHGWPGGGSWRMLVVDPG